MIRPQAVVLPILRAALPGVSVVSVLPDVDHRTYPLIYVRRQGGTRNPNLPRKHSRPAVELEVYSADGLIEAEELYDAAIEALYAAVANQTVVPNVGHLQSILDAHESTQTASEVRDTWKVTGKVGLGLRAA
ncbi:hypothetical protein [Mycolicibacterium tusciae]|uniref:DUF3168 domain-containing protein n=1 Tax=Mycolicibacterium tusciae TaxID=75922 RepID=A0A1X0JY05_9MYCO|nr:hypothetical protein [Mycolicibacterium tusciae]ORB67692.1 hypothetical protein BST47_04230 [Mycolicibacterium tusciae]